MVNMSPAATEKRRVMLDWGPNQDLTIKEFVRLGDGALRRRLPRNYRLGPSGEQRHSYVLNNDDESSRNRRGRSYAIPKFSLVGSQFWRSPLFSFTRDFDRVP